MRMSFSSAVMIIITLVREKKIHYDKKDILRIFLCGSLGMSVYFTFESIGIEHTSGAFTSLVLALVPVFGMFADRIIYGSRIGPLKIIGIVGSIAGVALLVIGSGDSVNANVTGIIFMLAAAVIWTFFIVGTKPLYEKYSLCSLLAGFFTSAAIISVPMLLIDMPLKFSAQPKVMAVLLVTTLVCIVFGEMIYVAAIGHLSVTTVSLSENILPLVTVLFSWIIFGQMLSGLQLAGGLAIIVSVSIISKQEKG